jgi:hypothetical protein
MALPAMLLRQRNPLAAHLAGSTERFRLHAVPGRTLSLPPALLDACATIGAHVELDRDGARLTIDVSHATMDAFGGMFLFATHFPAIAGAVALPSAHACARMDRIGRYSYVHYTWNRRPATRGSAVSTTLTQRVLGALIGQHHFMRDTRHAVVVAKDDPRAIDAATYLGSSLLVLEFDADELLALVAGSRAQWADTLARRSDRLAAIACKRPGLLRPAAVSTVFTSVGNIGRIPWTYPLNPELFEMVPTPTEPNTATVSLWGRDDHQALALCGALEHPVMVHRDRIRETWKEALEHGDA